MSRIGSYFVGGRGIGGKPVDSPRRYYICQFGGWWSFTPAQWRRMVEYAVAGGEFLYSDYGRMLSGPPRSARNTTLPSGRERWESRRPGVTVVQPVDWVVEHWREQLALLTARERHAGNSL